MPASFAPNYSQALHLPRLHVPGPDLPLPLPSVGVKAGLQGRLLAGTHRDLSPPPPPTLTLSLSLFLVVSKRERDGRIERHSTVYGSRLNRSWRAKRATGTKQRDSAGISIGERVEATEGPAEGVRGGRSDRVQNQSWLVEKRPWLRLFKSWGWSNQPPTAKNLIRCHNYSQWRSTSIEGPGSKSRRRARFLRAYGALIFLLFMGFMLNGDWRRRRRSDRCFLERNVRSLWCVSRLVLQWVGRFGPSYSNVLWNLLHMSFPNTEELVLLFSWFENCFCIGIRRFLDDNFKSCIGYIYI